MCNILNITCNTTSHHYCYYSPSILRFIIMCNFLNIMCNTTSQYLLAILPFIIMGNIPQVQYYFSLQLELLTEYLTYIFPSVHLLYICKYYFLVLFYLLLYCLLFSCYAYVVGILSMSKNVILWQLPRIRTESAPAGGENRPNYHRHPVTHH